MLDIRARTIIGDSLPYRVYQQVQYAASAKEMLKELTAIYGVVDAEVVAPAHDESPAKDMMKQRCLMTVIK